MKISLSVIIVLLFSVLSLSQDKQFYFVFLNSNPDREELPREELMKLQEGHMANIGRLSKEGKMIIAGPVKGGGGIFVLYASDIDEANDYLKTDPAIKAKRFVLEVYPVESLYGAICPVSEADFKMVNYSIIRHSKGEKENLIADDNDKLLFQVNFPGRDDGISVLDYDLEKGGEEELKNLLNNNYEIEYIKTLWIAEGSFCEKD